MLLHLFLLVDRMDESMELSEASFETASDEETDTFIREIDEQRSRTVESWSLNGEAGAQLKSTLRDSSKLWLEHRGFLKESSEHCRDAKIPIVFMLKELYEAASSSDSSKDERRSQQEDMLQKELAVVLAKQEEFRKNIALFTDSRAHRRKEKAAQMEILKKEKAEKVLKTTQYQLMAESGFASFGIQMDHKDTPTGVRMRIRFKKLSTIPGAEAGVIVEMGEKESNKLVDQWPKNVPGMRDLEMRLNEGDVDLTGFLIGTRGYFRDFYKSSDTFAAVFRD
ncbi:hypothetical protein RvY_05586 [Ramazzottius varieornatus]|uniref:Uncharacterized protein n=1 Tax=Ramazzottius varieornatus TaxID=947166 RepID=A0A1D1V5D0_RAMVA|nr:hypothetical protein RvY_05586 [Ramazzottius varieornatus]